MTQTDIESLNVSNPIHPSNKPPKVTNIKILAITAFLFTAFVVAEIIGALASNSLSLLGDGAAMSVDSFTVRIFKSLSLSFPLSYYIIFSFFSIFVTFTLSGSSRRKGSSMPKLVSTLKSTSLHSLFVLS